MAGLFTPTGLPGANPNQNPWWYLEQFQRHHANAYASGAPPGQNNVGQSNHMPSAQGAVRPVQPAAGAGLFTPSGIGYGGGPTPSGNPNNIGLGGGPQRNPPPSTTPPQPSSTGGTYSGTFTSGNNAGNQPPTGAPGKTWYPKPPTWVTQQSAYKPLVFPGVQSSGGGRTIYVDGSVVDYNSARWKKAVSYTPAEHADLWQALPDSWKADMAGWDPSFIASYLDALSNSAVEGEFGGKRMSGAEAAAEIVKAAREAQAKNAAAAQAKAQPAAPSKQFERFTPAY